MKKQKKIVYKIGDKVRIINPEVFIRCGYPWNKKYVDENIITAEERQKIAELLDYKFVEHLGDKDFPPYEKMLDALCYHKLVKNGFGGRERSIHTENRPELKDKIFEVNGKKTVKTGVYCSGSCDEWDYEPACLDNEKTHVILNLYQSDNFMEYIKIEEKNVEKVIDKKEEEFLHE